MTTKQPVLVSIRFDDDPADVLAFEKFATMNPCEAEDVAKLVPGESIRFGGGAAPLVTVMVLA
jgi:hypothetical protein